MRPCVSKVGSECLRVTWAPLCQVPQSLRTWEEQQSFLISFSPEGGSEENDKVLHDGSLVDDDPVCRKHLHIFLPLGVYSLETAPLQCPVLLRLAQSPCSAVCNNLSLCSAFCTSLQIHIINMLNFCGGVTSPPKNPVHPTPVFFPCVNLSVFFIPFPPLSCFWFSVKAREKKLEHPNYCPLNVRCYDVMVIRVCTICFQVFGLLFKELKIKAHIYFQMKQDNFIGSK